MVELRQHLRQEHLILARVAQGVRLGLLAVCVLLGEAQAQGI